MELVAPRAQYEFAAVDAREGEDEDMRGGAGHELLVDGIGVGAPDLHRNGEPGDRIAGQEVGPPVSASSAAEPGLGLQRSARQQGGKEGYRGTAQTSVQHVLGAPAACSPAVRHVALDRPGQRCPAYGSRFTEDRAGPHCGRETLGPAACAQCPTGQAMQGGADLSLRQGGQAPRIDEVHAGGLDSHPRWLLAVGEGETMWGRICAERISLYWGALVWRPLYSALHPFRT